VGRIAQADGGTLFIDEVAEIPPAAQAKLLRFFQFGEFQRIGSDRVERVNVRIIAATHQNLEQLVAEGRFRQDLYYRLNVVELEIPPLRERGSDVLLIADHFLQRFQRGKETELTKEARMALERYHYPGNVRELAHAIEHACVLARNPRIELNLLPKAIQAHFNQTGPSASWERDSDEFETFTNDELKAAREAVSKKAVEMVERAFVNGLLKRCEGNVSRAAREAGMHRTYLYKLLSKYKAS
jgi:Nif-specific regulatory protein/two-component system response regulator HydG